MAGTAALVFEYFTKGFYPTGAAVSRAFTPMGALIKAVLINSGQRMAGTEANRNGNTFPSTDQVRKTTTSLGFIVSEYICVSQARQTSRKADPLG